MAHLPEEMFSIIQHAADGLGPRLGRFQLHGRRVIQTPHYLGITSRGTIPHITQDTFRRDTNIEGVYMALEDYIEHGPRREPPIYTYKPSDGSSPLRRFTALPVNTLLVFGARRSPPVQAPAANPSTTTTIAVCTGVGFRPLDADEYASAVVKLKPDVAVALGDIPYGRALGSKRVEKATDRSIEWLRKHVQHQRDTQSQTMLFAPLLPVSCERQQFYVKALQQEMLDDVSGLALYDLVSLNDLPTSLHHLPRLAFTEPSTPQQVLQLISAGLDLLTLPFVSTATDAGIALDFQFPSPVSNAMDIEDATLSPLGIDMWQSAHSTDTTPLIPACQCHACQHHHRAYLAHLLAAKEMLGWVLLQIHNHHVIDLFFAGIRNSISSGTFQGDVTAFENAYQPQLPQTMGRGPRVRGYQFKSEGPSEPKKNTAPFSMLDDGRGKIAESTVPGDKVEAGELEQRGFAEKA